MWPPFLDALIWWHTCRTLPNLLQCPRTAPARRAVTPGGGVLRLYPHVVLFSVLVLSARNAMSAFSAANRNAQSSRWGMLGIQLNRLKLELTRGWTKEQAERWLVSRLSASWHFLCGVVGTTGWLKEVTAAGVGPWSAVVTDGTCWGLDLLRIRLIPLSC